MRDGGKEHLMYRPLGDEGLRLVGRALGLDDKAAKKAARELAPQLVCRSAAEAPPVVTFVASGARRALACHNSAPSSALDNEGTHSFLFALACHNSTPAFENVWEDRD
jgi:hypothetical protein